MIDKHQENMSCQQCGNWASMCKCDEPKTVSTNKLDKDEFRAIGNLAWMVKNSKQNVGLKMLDAADSVIRILKRKGIQ